MRETDKSEDVQELDSGYVGEALVVVHIALVGPKEEVSECAAQDQRRRRVVVLDQRVQARLELEHVSESIEALVAVDSVACREEEQPVGEVKVT